jgi:hypothetical protein
MEPLIELYLERTQVGQTTVLFSDDTQMPFEGHYILMTDAEDRDLGCPRVIQVQISAFRGAEDEIGAQHARA